MSTLQRLLQQVAEKDTKLAEDLRHEVAALESRRAFGLNFERHQPESVELPGCPIRRGAKVRILPPRDDPKAKANRYLWRVLRIRHDGDTRVADLARETASDETPETTTRNTADLLVVAEFRDPIYPGLVSTGKVERGGDKPFHTVINAENYHALEALLYTHEGRIDAIYIDPPYNTGAKDWKYNNDYVDADDAYRHSKWLAMMERRLKLAKRLLNPENSVLIVTIDEKEVHRLGLLLSQLLPEARIQMVTIVIQGAGSTRKGEMARAEEYAYFCFVGTAEPFAWTDDMLSEKPSTAVDKIRWESLLRSGTHSERKERPNLFYPIFIDKQSRCIVDVGDSKGTDAPRPSWKIPNGTFAIWPTKSSGNEGNWRVSHDGFRELLSGGFVRAGVCDEASGTGTVWYLGKLARQNIAQGRYIVTGKDTQGALIVEVADKQAKRFPIRTVWSRARHHAGWHGTNLVAAICPSRRFPFPKSLYAVEDALRVAVGDKSDATILDFFAGSGTTCHAVMRLNRQDGGRRQCISVTNNEVSADEQKGLRARGLRPGDAEWEALGICDYITKPRIRAAVTGTTPDGEPVKGDYKFTDEFPMAEGFAENVEFFTMTYEDRDRVSYHRAFAAVAPLLWLKAGATGRRIDTAADDYALADTYAVLFALGAAAAFLQALAKAPGIRMAFIVTDDDRGYQTTCRRLPEGVQPVRLYESYRSSFTINRERA